MFQKDLRRVRFRTTRLVAISVTVSAFDVQLVWTLFPCLIAMEDDTGVIQQNRNYILATCTALGGYEEKETAPGVIKQVYTLGDQALGN